jgi:outer membrane receptor protein involved in Fe transport
VGARWFKNDSTFPKNYYNNAQLKYNFDNTVPYQLTMYADQASVQSQQQYIWSVYAQDRWTFNRLSLTGGLRYEHPERPLRGSSRWGRTGSSRRQSSSPSRTDRYT